MEPLDVEAILKANPHLDRDRVQRILEKRRASKPPERDRTSPYRGRRATSDDRMNWTEQSARRAR